HIETAGGSRSFHVEIAKTPEQQQHGLKGRKQLADDRGMLFIYGKPSLIRMWMEETLIPLDMLFIDENGVIHHIAARAKPLSREIVAAPSPSLAVLELAGGAAGRLGIAAGDRIVMDPYFP